MSTAPHPWPASAARSMVIRPGRRLVPGPGQDPDTTVIDKRAVNRPVDVGVHGLVGDPGGDTWHHGGRDRAAFLNAAPDAERSAGELGRETTPGLLGENQRVSRIDVAGLAAGAAARA
jgi:MOSC domain-containing protein YiiM